MKIRKFGHCCLLIDINGTRILTDPGTFSTEQSNVKDIDIVLITHEHPDHLHADSLKDVVKNNPNVKIITNRGVGAVLDKEGFKYEIVDGRELQEIEGIKIEAYDAKHEEIYNEVGQVQNTGYFIGNKLFYPGDSFHNPEREVDVLALPVAGPWCPIKKAIEYALEVKPRTSFPVHDGMIIEGRFGPLHRLTETILKENGIDFVSVYEGDEAEF